MDRDFSFDGYTRTGRLKCKQPNMKLVEFMSRGTLKALDLSILKWNGIYNGVVEDKGCFNCALCQRFGDGCTRYDEECPVKLVTGESACNGSPYVSWSHHFGGKPIYKTATCDVTRPLAKDELDFLKDLRPENAPKSILSEEDLDLFGLVICL